MERLFALAEEIAPLLTGQWRSNRLAEQRPDIRHANQAVVNDDTQPGRQLVFQPCPDKPGRIHMRGSLRESLSRVNIILSEQLPARAVAGDINRRLLPGFRQEWREAETCRQAQEAKLELDRHQVALLRWFVLEFSLRSNRELSGADEFCFRDGSVQLSSSHKASLRLSLRFAGTIAPTPLLEITPEQWDRIVRTHLYGTFYCTVEMVRRFLKPKRAGKIVNVTAPSALRGGNGVADYASAKGGIIALTRNVARDLLPLNI